MKKNFLKVIACTLAVSSTMAIGGNVCVKAATIEDTTNIVQSNTILPSLEQTTINAVDEYIVVENNKFVLKLPMDIQNKISTSELTKIKESIKESNDFLAGKNITNVNKNIITCEIPVSFENDIMMRSYDSNGETSFRCYWWGCELKMSRSLLEAIDGTLRTTAKYGPGAIAVVITDYFPSLPVKLAAYAAGIVAAQIDSSPSNLRAEWYKFNYMTGLTSGYQN